MKVKVTRKHISKGRKGDSESCPIALALRDKFNLSRGLVNVYESSVVIDNEDDIEGDEEYYFIRRGQRFIQRFDKGLPVKPCTVELINGLNW